MTADELERRWLLTAQDAVANDSPLDQWKNDAIAALREAERQRDAAFESARFGATASKSLIARAEAAEAERDALAVRVEALEAMVRLLQYAGWDADKEWSCCPECEVPIRDPHAPGCPVATLLAPPTTEGKTTDEP